MRCSKLSAAAAIAFLLLTACFVYLRAPLQAQERKAATSERPVRPRRASPELTPEQMEELQGVKRELGINPFEGTSLDGPPAALGPTAELTLPQINALREAAFALDSAAHQLEKEELFDRADALRRTAQGLREAARGKSALSR